MGVELTTDGEWSWRGEGPCAARGDPPVRLAAAQYVRERRTSLEKRLRETWEAATARRWARR
jgi:hypothetical protein